MYKWCVMYYVMWTLGDIVRRLDISFNLLALYLSKPPCNLLCSVSLWAAASCINLPYQHISCGSPCMEIETLSSFSTVLTRWCHVIFYSLLYPLSLCQSIMISRRHTNSSQRGGCSTSEHGIEDGQGVQGSFYPFHLKYSHLSYKWTISQKMSADINQNSLYI